MREFSYRRPSSLDEAKSLFGSSSDAKFMSGGQTLLPTLRQRLASPSDVIDLTLALGREIRIDGDSLVIDAAATHDEVSSSSDVLSAIPSLSYLASRIGDPAVRNRGTLGGSIANNDPSADYPSAVLALGATIRTDRREISADDFFVGMFETALSDDEIVVSVSFPKPKRSGYAKFPNPASRYALTGVFAAETSSGVRVAATGASSSVFRVAEAETALSGNFSPDALANLSVSSSGMLSDIHGSSDYRAHLVSVMSRRAVSAAL